MEFIATVIDFFIHLDVYLGEIIATYQSWTYLILFLIIFAETGLVIAPILPGDSLLFAAGAFAGLGVLNIWALYIIFCIAAILGDTVNYWVGSFIGERIFKPDALVLKTEYLVRTHAFYEKHGGKAVIFARYVPIMRTLVPFVAGVGKMTYTKFAAYNVTGGIIWVVLFTSLGFFFGNWPGGRELHAGDIGDYRTILIARPV
jgi:membrane-associated protein